MAVSKIGPIYINPTFRIAWYLLFVLDFVLNSFDISNGKMKTIASFILVVGNLYGNGLISDISRESTWNSEVFWSFQEEYKIQFVSIKITDTL